jgi:hypothetical protein
MASIYPPIGKEKLTVNILDKNKIKLGLMKARLKKSSGCIIDELIERFADHIEANQNRRVSMSFDAKIFAKYGNRCMCCGAGPEEERLEIDHIYPRSTHPHLENDPDNLQILCRKCNVGKGDKIIVDYRPNIARE